MVVWRYLILVLFFNNLAVGQSLVPTIDQKLKGRYEFGFTPRFNIIQDFRTSENDTSFLAFRGIFRLQVGKEFLKNNYINLFCDYHVARTDISFFPSYDAYTFGMIYQKKFTETRLMNRNLKLFKRNLILIVYPEIFASAGITNFQNKFNSFPESNAAFNQFYFNYGVALNFYLSKRFNLQLNWPIEYFTGLTLRQPFFKNTLTQLVYKL